MIFAGGLHCLQSSVLQVNTKSGLESGCRETPLSVGLAGELAVQLTGACVTIRANHILMGRERIELRALQVTSDVFSSGVSAIFNNTGHRS